MDRILESWRDTLGPDVDQPAALDPRASYRPPPGDHALLWQDLPDGPDFENLEVLGEGGMGVVYRAQQRTLQRPVAVKSLHTNLRGTRRLRQRRAFVEEALINARLEHPNIVPVYALRGEQQGPLMLAMKLVEGQPWSEALREDRAPMTAEELDRHLGILSQVCNAVAFAHSRGIVHNDIKPANVMLGPFGEVQLLDWGLAVQAGDSELLRPRSRITSPCGTPAYMAPELARGEGTRIGPWTDVYLLGGILHEILTGRPPHPTESFMAAATRAARPQRPEFTAAVPAGLADICRRALAEDPDDRHSSVQAFQKDLQEFLRHRQSLALSAQAQSELASCRERAGTALPEGQRERLYLDFASAVAGFSQARQLWEANRDARDGQSRAMLAYARTGLAQGDLGLAAAQLAAWHEAFADGHADSEESQSLRAAVEAARAERARLRRSRRVLQVGLATAVTLIVAVLSVSLGIFSSQRAELRLAYDSLVVSNGLVLAQNDQLEQQRGTIALQLTNLEREQTVSELRGGIALATLDSLSFQVQHQLIDLLGDPQSQRVARSILGVAVNGWRKLADAELDAKHVSLSSAWARLQLARVLRQTFLDEEAARIETRAALEVFTAIQSSGDQGAALGHSLALLELLRQLGSARDAELSREFLRASREAVAAGPEDARAQAVLVLALAGEAEALTRDGALSEAAPLVAEALERAWQGLDGGELGLGNPQLSAWAAQARLLEAQGEREAAQAVWLEACALARDASEQQPQRADRRLELAGLLEELARSQLRADDRRQAYLAGQEAIELCCGLIDEGRLLEPVRQLLQGFLRDHIRNTLYPASRAPRGQAVRDCVRSLTARLGKEPESIPCRLALAEVLLIACSFAVDGLTVDGRIRFDGGLASSRALVETRKLVVSAAQHLQRVRSSRDTREIRLLLGEALLVHSVFDFAVDGPGAALKAGYEGWALGRDQGLMDGPRALRHCHILNLLGVAALVSHQLSIAEETIAGAHDWLAQQQAALPVVRAVALWNLAELRILQGEDAHGRSLLEEASGLLSEILDARPENLRLMGDLARIYQSLGRLEARVLDRADSGRARLRQAVTLLERVVEETPSDQNVRLNLAQARYGLAITERLCLADSAALALFELALPALPPSSARLVEIGQLRWMLGDGQAARRDFAAALALDTSPYAALWLRASGGEPDLDAERHRAGWHGRLVAWGLGDIDGDELLAQAGGDAEQLCEAHGFLGLASEAAGDHTTAESHYRAAVATDCRDSQSFLFAFDRLQRWPPP